MPYNLFRRCFQPASPNFTTTEQWRKKADFTIHTKLESTTEQWRKKADFTIHPKSESTIHSESESTTYTDSKNDTAPTNLSKAQKKVNDRVIAWLNQAEEAGKAKSIIDTQTPTATEVTNNSIELQQLNTIPISAAAQQEEEEKQVALLTQQRLNSDVSVTYPAPNYRPFPPKKPPF